MNQQLENKYKEASDLTNDIEVYIESLNNIINIKSRRFVSYSDLHLFCQQLVIKLADGNN